MPDLQAFFHPRSIALVGVPRGFKAGKVFLLGLLDQEFPGPVYPVHPQAAEVDGLRAYPTLLHCPDPVDMVIIMAPRDAVGGILEQCATKRVKAVVLYTSGFGETGEDRDSREQAGLLETALRGGFRILGPNCMGVYAPSYGLAPFPHMPRTPGRVGFITQSGSLGNLLTNACVSRKVFFHCVVSYGNACDIDLPELLEHLAEEPGAEIVCSYCEGVRDGQALRRALDRLAGRKPLIFWKVGGTAAGRRAAASHTGSLSGSEAIWKALFRSFGVLEVHDIEEMIDTLMAFYHLPWTGPGRVAIVSGPGGPLVSAADALEKTGLALAVLGSATTEKLRKILPPTGTSLKNPVDVGLAASFDLDQYLETLEALSRDDAVDAIVVLGGGLSPETNDLYVKGLIRIRRDSGKALLTVAFPGFLTDEKLLAPLYDSGIPVYPTPERALRAYARVQRFVRTRMRAGPV